MRRSPLGATWSILAPERSRRPQGPAIVSADSLICPFCEGNESETEPEVFALRLANTESNGRGWSVRVVRNKYPALRPNANALSDKRSAVFEHAAPHGFHEVIIESTDHHATFARLPLRQLETILGVYQSRMQSICAEPNIRSAALFRNEGPAAGASQAHPHAQLIALPVIPERLTRELAGAERHFDSRGCCSTCELLEREAASGRLVAENGEFAAVTAFAPRFPFETWIIPKAHCHDFRVLDPTKLRGMAQLFAQVFGALESALGAFPFNLVLQNAPVDVTDSGERAFHWRVEILPRLTTPSGFELGWDVFIVALSPEDAAAILRGGGVSKTASVPRCDDSDV
jgi:UDPglucose--hexose-1-phosphate uridylyltransferase